MPAWRARRSGVFPLVSRCHTKQRHARALHVHHQAKRFGAQFLECEIERVDLDCRPFRVACADGRAMTSSSLVIATGASAKWLGAPGEQSLLSRGVHTCATCDGYFYRGRHAAVVGGGDTAMEQALFLARFCSKVTVIHRRDAFRATKVRLRRRDGRPPPPPPPPLFFLPARLFARGPSLSSRGGAARRRSEMVPERAVPRTPHERRAPCHRARRVGVGARVGTLVVSRSERLATRREARDGS